MSSIIVFNLPNTITKNDLRKVFVNKGNVTNVQLIFTVNPEDCYFALISYQTEDEAIAAQSYFDKTYIFSKRVIVERCSEIVNEKDVDNNTKNPKNTLQATNNNEIDHEKNIENAVSADSLGQCNSSFVDHSHKKTSTDEVFNISTTETLVKNTESKWKPKLKTANMTPKCAKLTLSSTSEVSSRTSQKHIENSNNPEESNKVDIQYKNIIQEIEQLFSLSFGEVISSLIVDKTSDKHTSHELFVKSILVVSLRCSPNNINKAGKLFAELLSKKMLYMEDITKGIDTFLKNHNEYSEDYYQLFSNIAASVAQLLISKTASFEFYNLKDTFISLEPNKSTIFFSEVLKNIFNFKKSIKNHNSAICLYEKWWFSGCIHFDIFMSYNLVNKYYKIPGVGVFLLSMIMYNKMKQNSKLFDGIMHNWINTYIKAEVVKYPHFIQALTIAIILTSATKFKLLGNNNISFEDFIDEAQAKLLTQYISYGVQCERHAREFQCMYGIQMMSVVLKYTRDMVLKLCWKLCQDYNVISEESYDFFNDLQDIIFF